MPIKSKKTPMGKKNQMSLPMQAPDAPSDEANSAELRKPKGSLIVLVNQKNIDQAIPKNSSHCMIADAIKDQIPGVSRIAVDLQTIRFTRNGRRYTYLTPRNAQVNLVDWDYGTKPNPFAVRLRSPQITTQIRNDRPKTANRTNLGPKRLRVNQRTKKKGEVPGIIGGEPPPRSIFSGRREFGIRGHPGNQARG